MRKFVGMRSPVSEPGAPLCQANLRTPAGEQERQFHGLLCEASEASGCDEGFVLHDHARPRDRLIICPKAMN